MRQFRVVNLGYDNRSEKALTIGHFGEIRTLGSHFGDISRHHKILSVRELFKGDASNNDASSHSADMLFAEKEDTGLGGKGAKILRAPP